MKRCHKILIGLSLLAFMWVWAYGQLDLLSWLAIPIVILGIVGAYAAYDILGSILQIKSYP